MIGIEEFSAVGTCARALPLSREYVNEELNQAVEIRKDELIPFRRENECLVYGP